MNLKRLLKIIFFISKKVLKFFKFNSPIVRIEHISNKGKVSFVLHVPNDLTLYRANTFSTKEPETLNWIDNFGGEGPFYDIGANIGIYSLYHAKLYTTPVYAFEPSYFNLVNLAKNINLNNLTDRIIVISNPLFDSNVIANFNMESIEEGAAHSTFSKEHNQEGNPLNTKFKYKTLGVSLDHLLKCNLIMPPSIIKIDVDGIEHLILNGAKSVLTNLRLKSILVEVHSKFEELEFSVSKVLKENNFVFDKVLSSTENQIWNRH